MTPSIEIAGFEIEDITLMSPADPEFDSVARSLFQGNTDELLKLKPFLVILSNRSSRTVVAYALRWEVKGKGGAQASLPQHKYPDAVAGVAPARGNEVRSGEKKIVAMDIEIDCGRWSGRPTEEFYLSQFIDWFAEHAGATDLRIGLDAVIFEDGQLLGPDESHLGDHFAAYVNAKQELYRGLVAGLDAGQTMDEAFRPIEATIAASLADPRLDMRNLLALWRTVAAPEVRNWRVRYGDTALPGILRSALREQEFVVRRSSLAP
jgi:hypothetical protein